MYNVNVVVKPGETITDIIEQICQLENIELDDPFAFSAIMTESKEKGFYSLKINCLETPSINPFSPRQLVSFLFTKVSKDEKVRYVNPPLENYFCAYRPLLFKMINKAYPSYKTLIPDREDMMSILSLTIVKLHSKGYYLHNHLIYKSYINELNKEIRKIKNFQNMQSLDAPLSSSSNEDDFVMTLLDQLQCPEATEIARQQNHYTEEQLLEEMFLMVKEIMLDDMSEFNFDRIMIQIKTRNIDSRTSKILAKYREYFSPNLILRPGARKKNYRGDKND